MGYGCYAEGEVHLKRENEDVVFELLESFKDIDCVHDSENVTDDIIKIGFFAEWGNYHDDDWTELYKSLAPYIQEGFVDFDGDDGYFWRHISKDGKVWREHSGFRAYRTEGVDLGVQT